MKFPSWSNYIVSLSKFEGIIYSEKTKAANKIQALKDNHPVFDEIINNALPFLPPPFNGIAKAIYDSFGGFQARESSCDSEISF